MVLVYHINRRLILCLTTLVITLILIHKFEITYHLRDNCEADEPIDVVYTWVNGSDPKFLTELNAFLDNHKGLQIDSSTKRYSDKNELRFSLRSLEKFAPWVRHIYVVTNGQIPFWLNLDYEKVSLITHEEIFMDIYQLPTFSSPAIEAHLHRIPGLSKRFIYLNDDIFLGSPIYKDDFISPSRGFLIYLSWLLPTCAAECSWLFVADGHCDQPCNNPNCQLDGGDCDKTTPTTPEMPPNKTNPDFKLSVVHNGTNVSEIIYKHNKNVLLLDKLRRRKVRKHLRREYRPFNVDAYAASLQHTNRVLNNFYGFSVRKVPAHAPIMIDRDVMHAVQRKFARFFGATARNRVRGVDDVQYAFAYYYYVMHERVEPNAGEIFDRFDTDSSGTWSETEIRTVVSRLYDLPISDGDLDKFAAVMRNCSKELLSVVSKRLVTGCHQVVALLVARLGTTHRFKYEVIKDAEKKFVHFKMLSSNVSDVIQQLDDVRKNPKKFVCLNDNLDESLALENEVIEKILLDFYVSMFPHQSKFELPLDYRNRFLYVEDYVLLMNKQRRKFLFVSVCVFVIALICLLSVFKRKIYEFVNYLCSFY